MARLVIVLDIDDIDPTLTDPHEVADDLLDEDLPTFQADEPFRLRRVAGSLTGTFVSAEWAP